MQKKKLSIKEIFNLAVQNHKKNNYRIAENFCKKILSIDPNHFGSTYLLGTISIQNKNFDLAKQLLSKATEIQPKNANPFNNLGVVLNQLKEFQKAKKCFERTIQIKADHVEGHNNLGTVLKELGERDKALNCYQKAIEINPNYANAHNNLGLIFKELGEFKKAMQCYQRAIKINPNYPDAHVNIGNILKELGKFQEAIFHHQQAIKLNSENEYPIYNESMIRLSLGEFDIGWKKHEYRFGKGANDKMRYKVDKIWDGKYLDGTLVVWAEQGLGDHILFTSMLTDLRKYAKNIILQIDKRLINLVKRYHEKMNFLNIEVVDLEKKLDNHFDKHIAIGSLGQYLRKNKESFNTTPKKYLIPSSLIQNKLKKKYFSDKKFNIGISWKTLIKKDQYRNIDLTQMLPILSKPNCDFINLQFGKFGEEIKYWTPKEIMDDLNKIESNHGIRIRTIDKIDNYNDIENLASLINCLDLVITIDNSNAHLSGALGKNTWVMLVKHPIWTWGNQGEKSLWYPTTKLFRQEKIGDWINVISSIDKNLEKVINSTKQLF